MEMWSKDNPTASFHAFSILKSKKKKKEEERKREKKFTLSRLFFFLNFPILKSEKKRKKERERERRRNSERVKIMWHAFNSSLRDG